MTRRLLLTVIAITVLVASAADVFPSTNRNHRDIVAGSRTFPASSTILVESFPTGALVKVNNNVYGRTPCRIQIERSANSHAGFVTITVLPNTFEEYVQKRVFTAEEPLPSRLHFDMRIAPPNPAMDVYFN